MLGIFMTFIGFVLMREFFEAFEPPWWNRFGSRTKYMLLRFELILNWGLVIVGLLFTFFSSIQIGLVSLGCFIVLYNISLSEVKWKGIPMLVNPFVLLSGFLILITGLVFSFITSAKLGLSALAGSFVAKFAVNILMEIERGIISREFNK